MIKAAIIGFAAGLALLSSPASAQESDITSLANLWTSAYNLHDVDRLGALYTDGAHLYNQGRPRTVGRDKIKEFWAGDMTEGNPLTTLTVTDVVEGADMRLVHGNYQVINRQSGVSLGQGRFAHIWIRVENGQWLLDRDLWQPTVEE